jgi:LCP family protein required for cell wall assembly
VTSPQSPRVRFGLAVVAVVALAATVSFGAAWAIVGSGIRGAVAASPTPTPRPTPHPTPSPSPSPTPTPSPSPSPSPSPTPTPTATPKPTSPPDPELLGTDGRLTLLLLGSDERPSHPGIRTDAIIVASVDPVTGAAAAVSIPRDTSRVPLAEGGIFVNKVNALYAVYLRQTGSHRAAGERMRATIGATLGVEIDHTVIIGMNGFRELIDSVGGVDIHVDRAVRDPYYWVNSHTRGVYFAAGDHHFDGTWALIFARTRKGDSDWARAGRQQLVVLAAIRAVMARGAGALPALVEFGSRYVHTDLPLARAPDIYRYLKTADLSAGRRVVLAPRTYAVPAGGTNYALRLDVVRALCDELFPAGARATP